MTTPRKPRAPAKGWLLWLTLQDSPQEGEPYFTEDEILGMLRDSISMFSGIRVTRLKIQPLPRVEKRVKTPQKPPKSGI